jgi:hypothetical protein
MGVAGVAQAAANVAMTGNHRVGLSVNDTDAGTSTQDSDFDSSFNISIDQTTDGGTKISTGFDLAEESAGTSYDKSGLTLTFTDGSKLDVLNAGNASGSHDISIPGSAGEEGVTVTSTNSAPTGLDFATSATNVGFEYHTAEDFMMEGLTASVSYSTDTGAAKTATLVAQNHYAIGATYVSAAGDTDITFGTGYSQTEWAWNGATNPTNNEGGMHFGISAVTNDLTIAAGYADGNDLKATTNTESDGDVLKAGVKYVTGDITLNVGVVAGSAKDSTTLGTAGTTEDSYDKTSASVTYAVADGVSVVLGYSNVETSEEGTTVDTESNGSAWHIGANLSF